jgi:hypothetical protein
MLPEAAAEGWQGSAAWRAASLAAGAQAMSRTRAIKGYCDASRHLHFGRA